MAKSDDLEKLFDASQEVVREAFASALRIAEQRGVDPQQLIRASFTQLQALGFGMGYTPVATKPGSGPAPRSGTGQRQKPKK